MKPNPAWYPTSFGDAALWWTNFTAQMVLVGPSLGFTEPETDKLQEDNDIVQFVISAVSQMENIMAAARQYRKVILEGEIGEATPSWPAQFAGTLPVPAVPTGIYERLDAMVKRIRSSPNYTKETGALLGINPAKSDPVSPDLMKPQPSLTALPGNRVQVSFTRGTTNGIDVEMQVDNSGSWVNMGRYVKSPAELTVPENEQTLPRAVQIRARYFVGNSAVGQFSDVDVIATTP